MNTVLQLGSKLDKLEWQKENMYVGKYAVYMYLNKTGPCYSETRNKY